MRKLFSMLVLALAGPAIAQSITVTTIDDGSGNVRTLINGQPVTPGMPVQMPVAAPVVIQMPMPQQAAYAPQPASYAPQPVPGADAAQMKNAAPYRHSVSNGWGGMDTKVPALVPGEPLPAPVRIRRDPRSLHFIAKVKVDDRSFIAMIIDTGATGTLLSPEAARAAGVDKEIFGSHAISGIGSVNTFARARVRSFQLGNIKLGESDVVIGNGSMPLSLLGEAELRRFGKIEIEGDEMIITPRPPRSTRG